MSNSVLIAPYSSKNPPWVNFALSHPGRPVCYSLIPEADMSIAEVFCSCHGSSFVMFRPLDGR
jgi:hypothetical protein